MMSFPNFYRNRGENASYFLDDLEMALLASRRDEDEVKVRAFALVLREATKTCYQGLVADKKADWGILKAAFLEKYVTDNTPEKLWQKLCKLQQNSLGSYSLYEARFIKLWAEWEASLPKVGKGTQRDKKREVFGRLISYFVGKDQAQVP